MLGRAVVAGLLLCLVHGAEDAKDAKDAEDAKDAKDAQDAKVAPVMKRKMVMTPHGRLQVHEFGPSTGNLVVAVHGKHDTKRARNQWNPTAKVLAERGFHVLIPNFHKAGGPLAMGKLRSKSLRSLILNTLVPRFCRGHGAQGHGARKVIIMGKAYSSRLVAGAAAGAPRVLASVLVAPTLSEATAAMMLPKIRGKVALCMPVNAKATAVQKEQREKRVALYRKHLDSRMTLFEAVPRGGDIPVGFVEPIADFVASSFQFDEQQHAEL
eukprot:NODE_13907_length_1139_cov_15.241107.p1 GENE.NODE_13907_length_1139_cov_15.241107~~NODE_13907_length_1139_cov_15.241107.p1  ORF type:complete len:268 (+),score=64.83 NODE_13907_length_1139_cov_15.241107:99-902(+)